MTSDGPGSCLNACPLAIAVRAALKQPRSVLVVSAATLMMVSVDVIAETPTDPASAQSTAGPLQEIVVTAQRRAQNIQDVPYNISVIGGAAVTNSGATTINDLARVVTGLVTVDQGPAAREFANDLTLRGLRTDPPGGGETELYNPQPTVNAVSTYFGETPIFFPMVLADIDRVEVLRGPQGTLYGSGAEAGTIRVIPHQPDFSALAAEVNVTGSYTEFAIQPNSNVNGMLNLPLAENLALRVVAGQEHLAGFIKAVDLWELSPNGTPIPSVPADLSSGPVIGPERRGVNSSNQGFARASLRWKPDVAVDIQFDYQHQTTTQADSQVVSPNWSGGCIDFSASNAAVGANCLGAQKSAFYANAGGPYATTAFTLEPYADAVDLGIIDASVDLGFATFNSATSYDQDRTFNDSDPIYLTIDPGALNFNVYPSYYGYPRANAIASTPITDKSFVQEFRLASSGKNRFDYVVGAFYQRETRSYDLTLFDYGVSDFTNSIGQPVSSYGDLLETADANIVSTDKAVFGELTAHLTDAWQMTGGLRLYHDTYSLQSVYDEPLCGAACSTDQTNPLGQSLINSNQRFSGPLRKLNTSYDFGANTKLYATYSEGFRRGGTNNLSLSGPFATLPQYEIFKPDYAKNYEVGIKGALLDRRIRYSTAIYRIDLKNFQFNSFSGSSFPGTFNGSSARSKGAEFELQAAPTENLNLVAGYTYTDAKTTAPVNLVDLAPYALISAFGGTGPTDTLPIAETPAGARLPGVPTTTANIGIDYHAPAALWLPDDWRFLLHLDAMYRGAAPGNIDETSRFYWTIPSSVVTNARFTLDTGKHVRYELFVNNLTSNTAYSGASGVQTIANPYQLYNVARPRTVGVTLRYKF